MRRGGWEVVESFGTAGEVLLVAEVEGDILGRFASGELG